jgi:hypothetical protein
MPVKSATLPPVMGGARRRAARGVLAGALALTATLPAFATEVGVRCKRLTPEQRDELIARIRLSIHSAEPGSQPERVSVECSESEAQVLWEVPPTELLEVDEGTGLVEGVLDAVERRLASSPVPRQARPARLPPPTPAEQPDLTRPPRPPPVPASERRKHRAGGLGMGAALEPMLESGQISFGPRLDIGVGIGPVVALATEGFRLAHSAFIFDVAIGGGWGAPFDPGRMFGVAALVGIEYFSMRRADVVSTQAEPTATFTLGPRVALPAGPGAVWFGVDGRYRATRLEGGDPVDVALPQFSVIVSLGAMLLADPK